MLDPLTVCVRRQRDAAAKPAVLALPVPQPLDAGKSGTSDHPEREEQNLLKLLVLPRRVALA